MAEKTAVHMGFDIYAWQRVTEKTAMHIEFVIFCMAAMYGDTSIILFNNNFLAERDYECQILLCRILFAFRHKNNLLP